MAPRTAIGADRTPDAHLQRARARPPPPPRSKALARIGMARRLKDGHHAAKGAA
ncbi:MAG: hypothetical protein IPN84_11135 [Sphingomonadales bacterium]|nr:hypothetical protein [Sphingomonadales bacterium]